MDWYCRFSNRIWSVWSAPSNKCLQFAHNIGQFSISFHIWLDVSDEYRWLETQCACIFGNRRSGKLSLSNLNQSKFSIIIRFIDSTLTKCAAKALFPLIRRGDIRHTIDFLEQIYIANTNSIENRALFENFTKLLFKITKALSVTGIAACIIYMSSPAVLYYFDNSHLQPILPCILPGTTPGTANIQHFVCNSIYHVLITLWGIDNYVLFAMLFTILLMHVALMSNIMSNKLNGIHRRLIDNSSTSNLEIKTRFRNLILMHNELSSWVIIGIYYSNVNFCIYNNWFFDEDS